MQTPCVRSSAALGVVIRQFVQGKRMEGPSRYINISPYIQSKDGHIASENNPTHPTDCSSPVCSIKQSINLRKKFLLKKDTFQNSLSLIYLILGYPPEYCIHGSRVFFLKNSQYSPERAELRRLRK